MLLRKIALNLALAVPLGFLSYRAFNAVDPIAAIYTISGQTSLYLLFLAIIASSLRARKMGKIIGFWAFFYGFVHLLNFAVLDIGLSFHELVHQVTKNRFVISGAFSFVLMLIAMFYSRKKTQNRVKLRTFLVYGALFAGVAHFFWFAKSPNIKEYLSIFVAFALLTIKVTKVKLPSIAKFTRI